MMPLGPSPREVTIPAMIVIPTPIHVFLSNVSLKIKTPKIAVATSSIFNQMETEAALAVYKPNNNLTGPRKPPKKIIPSVFILLPERNNSVRLLFLRNKYGNIAIAAPR